MKRSDSGPVFVRHDLKNYSMSKNNSYDRNYEKKKFVTYTKMISQIRRKLHIVKDIANKEQVKRKTVNTKKKQKRHD